MEKLQEELDKFILQLKQSEIFLEYEKQKSLIMQQPELKQRVDEFRRRNYELQTTAQPDALYDEMERFIRENEELLENPLADGFLKAELALCRMVQDVTVSIVEAVSADFE